MTKVVLVSTNNNPYYLFYAPYQEKAWNSCGWDLVVLTTCDVDEKDLKLKNSQVIKFPDIPELRKETIAQTSRLYAANYIKDSLLMTCDMDLIPLQDYWKPDENKMTVYGHDLTWRSFYPMGYIAMTSLRWNGIMELKEDMVGQILEDVEEIGLALSDKWESWWNHDWTLITKRMKIYEESISFIDRGQVNIAGATLAKGRVDRFNWQETQKQPDLIDMHCETNNVKHPSKLDAFLSVYERIHGKL